jgi:alpha/beta hydrolase family protein
MSSMTRGKRVSQPAVEGPIGGGTGRPFVASTFFDLGQVGYSEVEFFLSGTATGYASAVPLSDDGKWRVSPSGTAAYRTRIVVYRPIDPQRCNGTAIVEWLNVSGGLDAAPDWIMGHTELIRSGCVWVGVSAQQVGVEGGSTPLGMPAIPLKTTDPQRYGSLVHPGDSFSYDIFSQAAQAVRQPAGLSQLSDLQIEKVIAVGESQSAFRMVTYINAVHPLADVFDGFLVHSRGAVAAPLSETPQAVLVAPSAVPVRDDLSVPVLIFQTETDLTLLSSHSARQPDSARMRLWEVAGTAHADTYTVGVGAADLGNSPDVANLVLTAMPVPGLESSMPINSGPQHFVLKAAIAALNAWVCRGTPPPIAPRLDVSVGPPLAIVRDANGNAVGGIRTPQVDVPIATLSGDGDSSSLFAALFGHTAPFDAAKLATLYPDHDTYVSAFNAAADRAVRAGFILPPDAALMKAAAAASDIGR